MFFIKKIIIFFLLISVFGCAFENITKLNSANHKSVSIDTQNDVSKDDESKDDESQDDESKDKYNLILKKYLKRKFNNKKFKADYTLKANISFASNETLSVSGLTVLNSTKAVVEYSLIDNYSNLLVKSGSFNTFPALSSTSNSIYTNEKSSEFIKERLTQSSAHKLYLLTNIVLRKLIEN